MNGFSEAVDEITAFTKSLSHDNKITHNEHAYCEQQITLGLRLISQI